MADADGSDAVSYRTLVTDLALLSVFLISGASAVGNHAVPVALPAIGVAFDLTESQIGLVMSAYSAPVIFVLPIISVAADVYGRRAVVIPSLIVFGLAGVATLAVTSYPMLLVFRVIQGAAFAGTLPLTTTLTGDLYTGAEGSSAQGMRSGINGLASAVSPVVAGVLAVVAWQYPFVLFALAFPAAAVVYRYYPEPVEPRSQDAERDRLVVELRAYWRAVRGVLDRRLAVFMTGGFTLFFLKGSFTTFLPVFVVAGLGASAAAAGTVLGVYGGTRVVVSPLAGSVLVRLGRRSTMLLGTLVAALGMLVIPLSPDLWWLGLASAVFACGEAILNPVLNDAVAVSAGADQRAGVMGGLQILKNASLTISPVILGVVIATGGFGPAFWLAAAFAMAFGGLVVASYPTVDPEA